MALAFVFHISSGAGFSAGTEITKPFQVLPSTSLSRFIRGGVLKVIECI